MRPTLLTRQAHRRVRALLIRRWARARLRRQDAVILDTETTDLHGEVVAVTVIDLHGHPLINTLVQARTLISPAATAVHGIHDQNLVTAPPLARIAPQLLQVTRGRQVLAYNAPYDQAVLSRDLTAAGLDPAHLAVAANWVCLMRARSAVENRPWTPLGGPHHPLGDCRATLEVLHTLAGRPA